MKRLIDVREHFKQLAGKCIVLGVMMIVMFAATGIGHAMMPDITDSRPAVLFDANGSPVKGDIQEVGKEKKKYKDGEILVKFKEHVPADKKEKKHKKLGHEKIKEFKYIKVHHVRLKKGITVEQAIEEYKADPNVEYAEPNYIVHVQGGGSTPPNDSLYQTLWGLKKIQAPQAWQTNTDSSDVVVAVIDSGIDYNHPDLIANLWTDTDGSHGYDAITGYNNPMDDDGHGTHVAGTIGAVGNNGIGVVGVNWNVKIMACKFLDAWGDGFTADAVTCLGHIKTKKIESNVNIIASNNSWGGGEYSDTLHDAIKDNGDAGILFIAAAGNNYGNDNDLNPYYPSSYDLPNVISVAATDRFEDKANFSNIGRQSVHVGAPGKGIMSTYKGSYLELSGTSMATPHVTGVAALIKAQNPDYDWRVIRNLLISHGDDVPAMKDVTISGKRINAARSIACSEINTPFFAIKKFPVKDVQAGVPVVLEAYSFSDCGLPLPSGTVTVTIPGVEEDIVLHDDVTSYNQETKHYEVANDGVFTGTWTPGFSGRVDFTFNFTGGVRKAASTTPLAITSAVSLPASQIDTYKEGTVIYAMLDGNFSQTLSASGGNGNYGWSITAGTLPPGLTLNGFTGAISGTPTTKGVYSYTVEVASGQMTSHSQFRIAVNSDLGGVESIKKRFESSYSLPPLVADLDGDGNDEVLVADGTKLNLYDKDGLVSSFAIPMRNPYQIYYNYAAGDLDNDGKKEVVLIGDPYQNGNSIVILDHRLNVIRSIPVSFGGWYDKGGIYTPVLADLFNDGNKQILYVSYEFDWGAGSNNDESRYSVYLNVIDRFGNQLSGWPKLLGSSDGKHRDHAPAVGDVDGDGNPEIVIATNDGKAHIYRADGTETKSWEVASSSPNYYYAHTPLLIDTDGQGIPKIALLMNGSVSVYTPNGDRAFWGNLSSQYSLVAADLDNDGKQELITAYNGWISGIKNNANIPNWPISISTCTPEAGMYASIPINATPVVGDIDGDGLQEILITAIASPGNPYNAFPDKWTTTETILCAFSAQTGQLLDGYPKRMIPGSAGSLTTPALADIDGNGRLDIIVKNEDGSLVKWQSAQPSATPRIDWPMFLGNSEHLGAKRMKRNVEITLSPGIYAFGGVNVGTRVTKSIVVSNRGSQTATVEYLGVTSGNVDGSFAISSGTCGASPFTLAPNSSCTYEAAFTPPSFGLKTAEIKFSYVDGRTFSPTVTMSGYGSHVVTASSDGPATGSFSFSKIPNLKDCSGSGTCTASFVNGETVTISFSPTSWANYVVAGWSGCDSVQGTSCIVTMTADKSVIAHTDVKKFTVKVRPTGSGTVTPYTAAVPIHGSHTITFRPAPGYYLESLIENSWDQIANAVPDSNGFEYSYTLNDVIADHNLGATFNNDITDGTLGFLLNEARGGGSSVVLQDGKFLLAGGYNRDSLELFDPATRSFSLVVRLPEARSSHTTTLLNDGRVLIAGGSSGSSTLQSAVLFDPATGAMTTLQMRSPRAGHRATLLADGRVLLTGGTGWIDGVYSYMETAEIFDPNGEGGGAFTEIAGPGSHIPNYHRTVRLPDSKVLVAFSDRSAYLYDPANGFVPTGSMLDYHNDFTATLLPNGKVLIVGGYSAELYDPATGTFSYTTSANSGAQTKPIVGRGTHSALLLRDGRVILVGGQWYQRKGNTVEYYDPTSGEFGNVGEIGYSRLSPALFELPSGEVLITGGAQVRTSVIISTNLHSLNYAASGNGQGTVLLSALAAGSSSPVSIGSCGGSSCQKRIEKGTTVTLTAVPLYSSNFVRWSGCDSVDGAQCTVAITSEKSVTAEFALKTFTVQGNVLSGNGSISPTVKTVAYGETVSYSITPASGAYLRRLLHNGSLVSAESDSDGSLVYTIRNVYGDHQVDVEFADALIPQVSHMLARRYNHTATLLQDGRVLIVGGTATGVDASGNYYDYGIKAAELYDPATGRFAAAGDMHSRARMDGARATLLQDSRVLLTGGVISGLIAAHSDAELYNPVTNSFSLSQGGMTASRAFHSSALLSDGRVLVAGGQQDDGKATNSAEIFDPASGQFTVLSAGMAANRKHHTSTVLPNGKVFIAGGIDENGAAVTIAEIYDPATAKFSTIGSMNIAHAKHRAILLPHGQVLLIDENGLAELFDPATNAFKVIPSYDPEWGYSILASPRQDFTATLAADGNVIIVGRSWYTPSMVESVSYFTETFKAVENVVSPRSSHAATLLSNGRILITGGKYDHGLSSALLLDLPAIATINPSTTDFSQVPFASTASRSITITNASADAHSLDAVTIAGADSSMFNISGGTCGTLPRQMSSQESCDVNISFSPTALGNKSATLLVSFSGTIASGKIEGIGIAPMTISPSVTDFANVLIKTAATKTIKITNISATSGLLDSVSVVGENGSMFAVSGGTCGSLPRQILPQDSCEIDLMFTPTSLGDKNAALSVGFAGVVGSITIHGIGVLPAIDKLSPQGNLFAWGSNSNGQLGDGTVTDSLTPVTATQVAGIVGEVAAVANSGGRTIALKNDGTVWAWGYGSVTPAWVPDLSNVVALSESLALRWDGTVWRINGATAASQQLTELSNIVAISGNKGYYLALDGDGAIWQWTTYTPPVKVLESGGQNRFTAIAAGSGFGLAVSADGNVWGWGYNDYCRLGQRDGDTYIPGIIPGISDVKAVAAGEYHSLALHGDGTISAWGGNFMGPLGSSQVNNYDVSCSPVKVTNSSGDVFAGASAIDAFAFTSAALKADGTVWSWGYNTSGQVGNGTTEDQMTPVQVVGLQGATAIDIGRAIIPFRVMTEELPYGAVGAPYSLQLKASTAAIPSADVWSLAEGSTLPAGLHLDPSGLLWGTPQSADVFTFTVKVTAANGKVATKQLAIGVCNGVCSNLKIDTTALPDGFTDTGYSYQLTASGGVGPYIWSGTVPAGFSLSESGLLTGNTAVPGTFTINVTVKDAVGKSASAPPLSLTIKATLNLTMEGPGTVTFSPGTSCAGNCTQVFLAGTLVQLTSSSTSAVTFDHWVGCDQPNGTSCTVTMSASKNVAAVYRYVDLVVTDVSFPATANSGDEITVSATIANQGNWNILNGFSVKIPLSNDPVNIINGNPMLTCYVASLAAGATTTCSGQYTIPVPTTGTYYVGAIADTVAVILESNEGNNVALGGGTLVITHGDKYPDLVVTDVGYPISAKGGDVIAVSATVQNQGAWAASSSFYVNIYLSSDATVTTSDTVMLQCYNNSGGLAVDASYTCSGQYTIPIATSGSFYVGAIADRTNYVTDDSNRANNTKVGAAMLTITRNAFPDLVVTDVSYPQTAISGNPINISATVQNQGAWAASSSFYVNIYLSSDGAVTTADTVMLQCYNNSGSLAVNASYTCSGQYTIPIATSGSFYVGAIADRTNYVTDDSNRANNTKVGAAMLTITRDKYPDLVVTDVSCTPTTPKSGDTISCTSTVKNQGTWKTSYFNTGIYLSGDATVTTADNRVRSCYVSPLDPGATTVCSGQYTIPITTTGTFYVGAIADYTNITTDESNETNNTLVGANPMTITAQ